MAIAILPRGIAQLVEQRSPKPRAEGSNPSAPAIWPVGQAVKTAASHAANGSSILPRVTIGDSAKATIA